MSPTVHANARRRYPVCLLGRRPSRTRSAAVLVAVILCPCAVAMEACGNTLQDQPIGSSALESVIVTGRYPVYWLGGTFRGLAITGVVRDPGGAFTIQYGNCTVGGQYTCVTPLAIVSSPDNSFIPGERTHSSTSPTRGVRAVLARQGNTIAIPTGGVVVDIYAEQPSLARAAAETMVPINLTGIPGARLPSPLPDTGFAERPLASQPTPPAAGR